MNGIVDNVRIFHGSLTAADVKTLAAGNPINNDDTKLAAGESCSSPVHRTSSTKKKPSKKLTEKDAKAQGLLAKQDAALDGKDGGLLRVINGETGETLHKLKTDYLPAWDGMIAANGQLVVVTTDRRVVSLR